MNSAIAAAETAWNERRGAWREFGDTLLLAYEYRMCVKLGALALTAAEAIDAAFQRVCVDMRTMKIVGRFGFDAVPPPYRLWYWADEEAQAKPDLGLR